MFGAREPVIGVAKVAAFDNSRRVATLIDLSTGEEFHNAIISSNSMASDGAGDLFVPEIGAACLYYHHRLIGTYIINFIPDVQDRATFGVKESGLPESPPPNSRMIMTKSGMHVMMLDGDAVQVGVGAHGYSKISFLGRLFERVVDFFRSWAGGHESGEISGNKIKWKKVVYAKKRTAAEEASDIIGNRRGDGLYLEYDGASGFSINVRGQAPIKLQVNGIDIGTVSQTGLAVKGTLSVR